MKLINTLRAVAVAAGFAIAMFGTVSLIAPSHAFAGYWTTTCDRWGCQRVYVPTCHRVLVGYTPGGRPIFDRVCH